MRLVNVPCVKGILVVDIRKKENTGLLALTPGFNNDEQPQYLYKGTIKRNSFMPNDVTHAMPKSLR